MYLQAIFVSTFYRTYPHTLKYILMFGTAMGSIGLIGSAFATKVRRPLALEHSCEALAQTLTRSAGPLWQPFHLVLTLGICFPFASVSGSALTRLPHPESPPSSAFSRVVLTRSLCLSPEKSRCIYQVPSCCSTGLSSF